VAADGVCLSQSELPPDAKPLPDTFPSPSKCASGKTISLALDYYPAIEAQLFGRLADDATGERSFRYRVPAQVRATLEDDQHSSFGGGVFSVAQFGTVVSLPAKRASKALTYELGFVEATGALKTFKLGTTGGLDAATVDALAAAGGTALDARNKARVAEDELSRLTRDAGVLKLQDEICTIQKKYNLPCTVEPR
jgi:hypothetical protein